MAIPEAREASGARLAESQPKRSEPKGKEPMATKKAPAYLLFGVGCETAARLARDCDEPAWGPR